MVSRELLMLIGLVSLILFIELTFHDRTFCEGKMKISVKFFLYITLFCGGFTFLILPLFHMLIDKSSKDHSILTYVISVLFILLIEGLHCMNTNKKKD